MDAVVREEEELPRECGQEGTGSRPCFLDSEREAGAGASDQLEEELGDTRVDPPELLAVGRVAGREVVVPREGGGASRSVSRIELGGRGYSSSVVRFVSRRQTLALPLPPAATNQSAEPSEAKPCGSATGRSSCVPVGLPSETQSVGSHSLSSSSPANTTRPPNVTNGAFADQLESGPAASESG